MWTMEDVLSELNEREENGEKGRGKNNNNNNNNGMAPGFRFHPTDEELITYYLASKVFYNHNFTTPFHIAEVDLNRCEPWDLPEGAKMGEKEWYIYSLRDRKYPTGLRTNRATGTGYWKATGKDRQVHAGGNGSGTGVAGNGSSSGMLIGMKKTLVFYQGRAPRGVKTRWVMHEYRLDGLFSSFRLSSKEEWVICRIFQKHGGEKKHFHPPPPPLSPFLRCLPPLLDVPATSSSSSTTKSLQNNNNNNNNNKSLHFPSYNDSNFLLQSLLSNPLPNFSSMTNDPTTATTTVFTTHSGINPANPSASTTAGPTGIDHLLNVSKQNSMLDKICHTTTNNGPLFSMPDDDVEDDVAVRFDMSSSVATLDRLLNPHQHHQHVNFSTECWPFHQ